MAEALPTAFRDMQTFGIGVWTDHPGNPLSDYSKDYVTLHASEVDVIGLFRSISKQVPRVSSLLSATKAGYQNR